MNPLDSLKKWTEFVDDDVLERRRAHCDACDKNWHGFCKECKCYLDIKNKLKMEYCPLGKWRALPWKPPQ